MLCRANIPEHAVRNEGAQHSFLLITSAMRIHLLTAHPWKFMHTRNCHQQQMQVPHQISRLILGVQWGVFVLFACCVFLMTLSVYLFFPETKGVPIEDCPYVFKHHWYWKK